MSLLNDALRKRKEEQLSEESRPVLVVRSSAGKEAIKKRGLTAGLCGLVVLIAVIVGSYGWRSVVSTSGTLPAITPPATYSDDSADQALTTQAAVAASAVVVIPEIRTEQIESEETPSKTVEQVGLTTQPPPPVVPAVLSPKPGPVPSVTGPGGGAQQKKEAFSPEPPPDTFKRRPVERKPNESVARLYQKARLYHRQNRLKQAVVMYREVLKIDPDHFNALFNLTSAYLQTGHAKKAHRIAADMHLRSPDNHQVTLNLAIALIGIGHPAEAIRLLDQVARQHNVPLFEICFHKGVAHRHLGQLEQAIAWYKKAEQIKPADASLLFNLAVAFDQQLQYDLAVDYYGRYLQESKNSDLPTPLSIDKITQRIKTLHMAMSQQ